MSAIHQLEPSFPRVEIGNSRRTPSTLCLPRMWLPASKDSVLLPVFLAWYSCLWMAPLWYDALTYFALLLSSPVAGESEMCQGDSVAGRDGYRIQNENNRSHSEVGPNAEYWRLEMTSGLTSQDRSSQKRREAPAELLLKSRSKSRPIRIQRVSRSRFPFQVRITDITFPWDSTLLLIIFQKLNHY